MKCLLNYDNVYYIAAGNGMGKTSSMAMLAMKYVDGETEGRSYYICVDSVVDQHSMIPDTPLIHSETG